MGGGYSPLSPPLQHVITYANTSTCVCILLFNIRTYVYIVLNICISDDLLKTSKSSLLLEVNHILHYVQEKFSEVLLPVDTITKEGLLGKGYKKLYKCKIHSFSSKLKPFEIITFSMSRSIWCSSQRGNDII